MSPLSRHVLTIALLLACASSSARAERRRARPRLRDRLVYKWMPNRSHEASVGAVATALRQRFGKSAPAGKDWQQMADLLMRRSARIPISLLPAWLPALPRVEASQPIAELVKTARRADDTRRGYAYLERQAAGLRGSSNADDQKLGTQLSSYLSRYKSKWGKRWLRQQRARFAKASRGSWRFTEATIYDGSVSAEQRTAIEQRIARARRVLEHTVDPQVLMRMPPVPIQVGTRYSGACIVSTPDGRKLINLTPHSSVKDLLHELGHWVEDFGGWRVLATMHGLRRRRSDGRLAKLGELLQGTTYSDDQRAFRGKFVAPYIGRHYQSGATEVLSMGLERLRSTRAAYRFFQQDGEHLLLLLASLQGMR